MNNSITHRVQGLICLMILILLAPLVASAQRDTAPIGMFEGQGDIGTVLHAGSASYNAADKNYSVTGSGENMWFGEDDFHYLWKKVSGDFTISADIKFFGTMGDPHRKAVLMIRQTLDGNSSFVDVARHGDGLTSLQFRDGAGTNAHEVEFMDPGPLRVAIERRGDYFYGFFSGMGGKLHPAGASTKLVLSGPLYVGIGVSAHNKDQLQTAIFSNVKIETLAPVSDEKPVLYSTLETVSVNSGDRRVAYVAPAHFEAPNWSNDGSFLLFNQDGGIYRLPLLDGSTIYKLPSVGEEPMRIPTGPEVKCNNDHGISPDGKMIAVSDSSQTGKSLIYTLPITGGSPTQITKVGPSYFHGWSPDGSTLVFTGERDGNFDIYAIPATGGEEKRLTTAEGLDDGPEYLPDGQWIFFNSVRTGHMQIWRMHPDGSGQEQVISDETNDWFPHVSPNGKWMTYLSYAKDVTGHPGNKDVTLNVMSLVDKKIKVLATLYGGQGTNNVNSWSPDSSKVAFVTYEYLTPTPRN
jgi:Tol biopolymer transport system component